MTEGICDSSSLSVADRRLLGRALAQLDEDDAL
jgi:hypothetical protein